eukprot:TRINITY_DN826_c0_g10_i1.p1 TRINITY_DN826_c0_g10~~TRINITY_DN826_c0_g10_i1.p1  ORF type:complete len:529 (+),score=175.11 TRINITY_DN826_c0_g10_i1:147-1733(+)
MEDERELKNILQSILQSELQQQATGSTTDEANAVNMLRSFLQLANQSPQSTTTSSSSSSSSSKRKVHEDGARSDTRGPCNCGYKHWLDDQEYDYILRFELTRTRAAMLGYNAGQNVYEVAQEFVAREFPEAPDPQQAVMKIADAILQQIGPEAGMSENNNNNSEDSVLTLDLSAASSSSSSSPSSSLAGGLASVDSPYLSSVPSSSFTSNSQNAREQMLQEQRKEKKQEEEQKNKLRQQMLLQRKEREANEKLKKTTQAQTVVPARQLLSQRPQTQQQQPQAQPQALTTEASNHTPKQPTTTTQPKRFLIGDEEDEEDGDEDEEDEEDEEDNANRLNWANRILSFKKEELMMKTNMNEQHAALVFKLAQEIVNSQQHKKSKGKGFKAFSGHGHTLAAESPVLSSNSSTTRTTTTTSATTKTKTHSDVSIGGPSNPIVIDEEEQQFVLDETAQKTTIQIRLHNNTRIVGTFNLTHRISDVRNWLRSQRPKDVEMPYELMCSYPVKKLTDLNQTIQDAGIQNSMVHQKLL